MGLLTATLNDVKPRGQTLPDGTYRVTIESAGVQAVEGKGTQWARQYGSIRTRTGAAELTLADGSSFVIGNRKLFARDWIDHSNPEAARVGNSRISQEAISAGLQPKPTTERPTTDLPYSDWDTYGSALVGREVLVTVKAKSHKNKLGENVTDAKIVGWVLP